MKLKTLLALGLSLFTASTAPLLAGAPPNPQPPGNIFDSRVVEMTGKNSAGNSTKTTLRVQGSLWTEKNGKTKWDITVIEAKVLTKGITGNWNEQNLPKSVQWSVNYQTGIAPNFVPATPQNGNAQIPPNGPVNVKLGGSNGKPVNMHGKVTLTAQGYPTVQYNF